MSVFSAYNPGPQNLDSRIEYAGFSSRFTANIVDATLMMVIWVPLLMSGFFDFEQSNTMGLVTTPLGILIWSLCESSSMMGTPGKWIIGIKVINQHGQRISFSQAFGRQLIKTTLFMVPIFNIVLFFISVHLLTKPQKQLLHDMGASTFVAHSREKSPWKTFLVFVIASSITGLVFYKFLFPKIMEEVKKEQEIIKQQAKATADNQANKVFESVDEAVYRETLGKKLPINEMVPVDSTTWILNHEGPVYAVLKKRDANHYLIEAYFPYLPNIMVNSKAVKLNVTSIKGQDQKPLTLSMDLETSMNVNTHSNQKYILAQRLFTVEENLPIGSIDGEVTFMLPLNLKSQELLPDTKFYSPSYNFSSVIK